MPFANHTAIDQIFSIAFLFSLIKARFFYEKPILADVKQERAFI